jgi:hypothetical protein
MVNTSSLQIAVSRNLSETAKNLVRFFPEIAMEIDRGARRAFCVRGGRRLSAKVALKFNHLPTKQ